MHPILLVLGGLLTLSGAGLLVMAFRHGQAGRPAEERRLFRLAVGGLAVGSLCFLGAAVLAGR